MSYIPSTNDDTTSYSLNKIKDDRRNQRNSNKYIHPKNHNINNKPPATQIQNRKLRPKK